MKQDKTFCNIIGLKETDIKILKSLLKWPYSLRKASSFNISMDAKISTAGATTRIRALNIRGIVNKSITGSYFIPAPLKKKILSELGALTKTEPRYLEFEDEPIKTTKAFDKLLDEQLKAEQVERNVEEKKAAQRQQFKNVDNKMRKKADARKYYHKGKKNGKKK